MPVITADLQSHINMTPEIRPRQQQKDISIVFFPAKPFFIFCIHMTAINCIQATVIALHHYFYPPSAFPFLSHGFNKSDELPSGVLHLQPYIFINSPQPNHFLRIRRHNYLRLMRMFIPLVPGSNQPVHPRHRQQPVSVLQIGIPAFYRRS